MLFFGRLYLEEDVFRTVWKFSAWGKRRAGPSVQTIDRGLADGNIIAWFSGRSQFGPRRLGRSRILADPRDSGAKKRMKHLVKRREGNSTFAPVGFQEFSGGSKRANISPYRNWTGNLQPVSYAPFQPSLNSPSCSPTIRPVFLIY